MAFVEAFFQIDLLPLVVSDVMSATTSVKDSFSGILNDQGVNGVDLLPINEYLDFASFPWKKHWPPISKFTNLMLDEKNVQS